MCGSIYKRKKGGIRMIDLHLHTTASDGSLSPSELVERANERGLKVISITDHDTVDGLAEGRKKAKDLGIEFINGIEISCDWLGKEVHILGYFLNCEDEKFLNELKKLRDIRIDRNIKMIEKLNKNRIEITIKELQEEAGGGVISRAHMSQIIMRKGYAYSNGEVFSRYLGYNGIAYVPKKNLTPDRAVKIIKDNGGIVSLAHPKLITRDRGQLLKIIRGLKEIGLDGIEVYHGKFDKGDVEYYGDLANETNLIFTGGSDFHGSSKSFVDIGDGEIPMSVYNKLLACYKGGKS
jgi:predicted metal-dependent phosphoesterase TrpH